MTENFSQPTRRSLIAASAVSSAGLSISGCAGARRAQPGAHAPIYDFSRPEDNVEAIVKIQGDTSGRATYNWRQGHVFGLVDGQMAVPMMRYQSAQIGQFIRQGAGSFAFKYRGIFVYQDFETGAFIDEFENPFTNEKVAVKHFKTSIGEFSYTPLGPKPSARFKGNTGHPYGTPYILPWVRSADHVWVTLDERVEYARPSDGVWRRDNALIRYEAKWAELMNPALTSVAASSSFHTHVDWFTWLNMPGHPGGLMQGGAGRKFFSLSELPEDLVAFAEDRFPGALSTLPA